MATNLDRLLLAKVETTKGTDIVPVVADNAIRIKTGKISVVTDAKARTVVKPTMGNLAHIIGKQGLQLEIEVELKPSGTAGTAPEVGVLLRGCGMLETLVAVTSAAYEPLSTISSHKSLSMYWYEDGLLWKLLGAQGKVTFDANIGEIGGFKFTFQAAYAAPTAVTCPTGAVYQSAAPIVMSSADVFTDGATVKVGVCSFDDGTEVQEHYTTGGLEYVVRNRNPKMKITKDSVSTAAEWTALTAGTNVALSCTFGTAAGSRLVLTGPYGRRESVAQEYRGERPIMSVGYGLYESAGDDQFKFLFN